MANIYETSTTQLKNSKVGNFYDIAMKELIDFYGINWVENKPVIYLVGNREDFDMILGYTTEDWEVGKILYSNKILLLSPDSYDRESKHKYSDEEYYSLLKHELSHLFYSELSRGKGPVWLDEGFAVYTSEQLIAKDKPKQLRSFIMYYSHIDEDVYSEAGFVVEGLINKYGKEKVINFLKLLPNINSEDDFKKEFKRYFGLELDYKDLQCLL